MIANTPITSQKKFHPNLFSPSSASSRANRILAIYCYMTVFCKSQKPLISSVNVSFCRLEKLARRESSGCSNDRTYLLIPAVLVDPSLRLLSLVEPRAFSQTSEWCHSRVRNSFFGCLIFDGRVSCSWIPSAHRCKPFSSFYVCASDEDDA